MRIGFSVCRAGWMMGSGPAKDKKFIQKLMKQLKGWQERTYSLLMTKMEHLLTRTILQRQ
jgi:hypothetical protein